MSNFSHLTPTYQQSSKKPLTLVVDDEPNNLDLLYRTFRKEFKVLKAESGAAALEILAAEGEVSIIISDQRMPQMKGTEFLSRTVADFPDTVRIILTGIADVSDLVDAINTGQVYRNVTKPWEAEELQQIVEQALENYNLAKAKSENLHRTEKLSKLLMVLSQLVTQPWEGVEALTYVADSFGQILSATSCSLVLANGGGASCYGTVTAEAAIANELVQTAMSTQQTQSALNIQSEDSRAGDALYSGCTQSHLVVPVSCDQECVAALSFQWNTTFSTLSDVAALIELIAPQLALCLQKVAL